MLVAVVSMYVSAPTTAAPSLKKQIKSKESQIEKSNSNLNKARKKVRDIEKRLKAIQLNTDKTRRIVMEERQALRLRVLSSRKAMKKKSHALTKVQNEIIRANTRLKLAASDDASSRIRSELTEIKMREQVAARGLVQAEKNINNLEKESKDTAMDSDPRIIRFIEERQKLKPKLLASKNQVYQYRKQVQKFTTEALALRDKNKSKKGSRTTLTKLVVTPVKPAKKVGKVPSAYVYAISGMDDQNIESSLRLRDWIESYDAVYIEGHWNNLYGGPLSEQDASIDRFTKQFEKDIKEIPRKSKLILIGHGLGGGAVIAAATGVAAKHNRKVDYLVALDPVGTGNLRANIVFDTADNLCQLPAGDTESNNRYSACIKKAKPRHITKNIANFYNRWQKDSQAPMDYYKELMIANSDGRLIKGTTATGKFKVASSTTKANQKREFFEGNEDAHQKILSDAANRLPNLLIDYIR